MTPHKGRAVIRTTAPPETPALILIASSSAEELMPVLLAWMRGCPGVTGWAMLARHLDTSETLVHRYRKGQASLGILQLLRFLHAWAAARPRDAVEVRFDLQGWSFYVTESDLGSHEVARAD